MFGIVAAPPGDAAYTWVVVLACIIGLVGTGGLVGLIKYTKNAGVRDKRLDDSADVVLGTDDKRGLERRFDDLETLVTRRFDALDQQVGPNGGKSVHDMARRTEAAVKELGNQLNTQSGENTAEHAEFRRRLAAIERRPS